MRFYCIIIQGLLSLMVLERFAQYKELIVLTISELSPLGLFDILNVLLSISLKFDCSWSLHGHYNLYLLLVSIIQTLFGLDAIFCRTPTLVVTFSVDKLLSTSDFRKNGIEPTIFALVDRCSSS